MRIRMSSWFKQLFGESEPRSGTRIRKYYKLECDESPDAPQDAMILVAPSGERFAVGALSTPSLSALRTAVPSETDGAPKIKVIHVAVGDILEEHARLPGATIQAASQFNGLEFPDPTCTPEQGITAYQYDPTQGPACALACAPATLVRNYMVDVKADGSSGGVRSDATGQTKNTQICALRPVLSALGASAAGVAVRNGYTFEAHAAGAKKASKAAEKADSDELTGALRVIAVRGAQVVYRNRFNRAEDPSLRVTQMYCSALSIGYSNGGEWAGLARIILDAAYEATLLVAEDERRAGRGSGVLFLTFVGGGVFRNEMSWIAGAIGRAVGRCASMPLDVRVCHYRRIDENAKGLVDSAVKQALCADT